MVEPDPANSVTPERARSRDLMRDAGAARAAHRLDEALALYMAAVEADRDNAAAAHNLGVLLAQMGRPAEGETHARRALSLAPDEPMAAHALAHALMIQGKYREGWALYEARAALPGLNTGFPVDFPFPRWRGETLTGKRLAIFPEQGLGDQIQFARFVPRLVAQAGAVTLLTAAPLERLFRHNFPGADIVVAKGDTEFPDPDCWTTLHDLPGVLGIEPDTIPAEPYLRAPGIWAPLPPGFRVGLKVKGNPKHSNDRLRSLPEASADRLRAALPGAVVSLEPEESGARDMADTAALIAQLDLVVSVDTSVAHLAGAMGKPCLLLVPGFAPDWRWMVDRADSPWYPHHRLFRSGLDGNWDQALDRLIEHAHRLYGDRAASALTQEAIASRAHGDPWAALAAAEKAVAIAPDDPAARHALGWLLTYTGRLREGEAQLRRLAETMPARADTRYVLGLNLLLQGRYREGWPFYQARTQMGGRRDGAPKGLPFPRWNGEDLKGKRLVVFPEQGFGDQIHFARFLPELVLRGAEVIALTAPPLARLFRHNFPGVTVLDAEGRVHFPDPHFWATFADLPVMLGVAIEDIPAVRYIREVDPPVSSAGEGFRIGYKFKGNPAHPNDIWRSLPEGAAARLLQSLPGTLVSLEPEDSGARDFADTAALIAGLDLIVSVDTSIAHLAGAMGKRCLLLVAGFEPDWRWMLERWDSPWYPGHWLYRGDPDGGWDAALDRLTADAAMLARLAPAAALLERARMLREAGQPLAALDATGQAVAADPGDAGAAYMRGVLLSNCGRPAEGEALLRQVVDSASALPNPRHALGANLLGQGRYREGWPLYEARIEREGLHDGFPRSFPYPRWQGEDLNGKRIAIFPEQGFGDQIQFVRFVPELVRRGASVTLLTVPPLARLFAESFPEVDVVVADGTTEFPDPDFWATLADLPVRLDVAPEQLDGAAYLRAPEDTPRQTEGFRIGVVTRGSAAYLNDRYRSLPPAMAERLTRGLPGEIVDLSPERTGARDFADTAAIVAGLDLVVSVDTSVAHLAGALGTPCFLLIPGFAPDWRWMRDRGDSPWYARHRLYRSTVEGDWNDAIDRVRADVALAAQGWLDVPPPLPGAWSKTLEIARKNIKVAPGSLKAQRQLGQELNKIGDFAEAEALLRAAIAQGGPDEPRAHYALAFNLLAQGRYREAWPHYRSRIDMDDLPIGYPRGIKGPRWQGQPLAGKRVAVLAEQGMGDTLQLARFLPRLVAQGATVTLFERPALVRLLQAALPLVAVREASQLAQAGPQHVWTTTFDMLEWLDIGLGNLLPAHYIAAPAGASRSTFRIGLCTSGNPGHMNDKARSLPPAVAGRLRMALPGEVVDLDPAKTGAVDFADTAKIMADLDLVVSVDTSVAHLAGAMDKTCLLLVPGFGTDWRWLRGRDDSPWYPRHHLFWSGLDGDWNDAVDRLCAHARTLAAKFERRATPAGRGRWAGMVEEAQKAVEAAPRSAAPLRALGSLLTSIGEIEKGEVRLRDAVALGGHDVAETRYALALNLLAQERYREAWPLHAARADIDDLKIGYPKGPGGPRWRGQPLAGKKLVVLGEQGVGDTLQLARFLPRLVAEGAIVTLVERASLVRLLQAAFPSVAVRDSANLAAVGPQDYWTTIFDMLEWLDVGPGDVPPGNYVAAPERSPEGGFRIGLMTSGNPSHVNDARRSLPPALAARLREALPGEVVDLDPAKTGATDFADTAEIIAGLDLVVSVDTSVAHLAGAMGKPCLLLVPFVGTDWRWTRGSGASRWYPRHRLFWNAIDGDWSDAIARLAAEARRLHDARG